MTSILTNNGAMVALQTLKSINSDLESTQSQISTGKDIASAKDNSAIWAISKVMESDVSGFKAVKDSLALGESTVAVASSGAEQIVEKLKEMKELVVTATGENVDHTKINANVTALKQQISDIIGASQFNGANLLRNATLTDAGTNLTVTSSLDRNASGAVTANTIDVNSVNLEGKLLATQLDTAGTAGTAGTGIDYTDAAGNAVTGITLGSIDVTSAATADTSVVHMEALINEALTSAASLGASSARISDQGEFIGKLSDSMKSGIGSLVDADMEEASARLKALQTQQQLGVQALSIANQAPGAIMALFR